MRLGTSRHFFVASLVLLCTSLGAAEAPFDINELSQDLETLCKRFREGKSKSRIADGKKIFTEILAKATPDC